MRSYERGCHTAASDLADRAGSERSFFEVGCGTARTSHAFSLQSRFEPG